MFEVSPQIKDYWPRRTGASAKSISSSSTKPSYSNTSSNDNKTVARSKEIVEENGEKPLYYQREQKKSTKNAGTTSVKPNTNTSATDNIAVERPKEIIEVNGEKPLYYQREGAQTKKSKL